MGIDMYARASVKKNLGRILSYLATQKDTKAYVLKYNGLEKAMQMAEDKIIEIRFEGLRLMKAFL